MTFHLMCVHIIFSSVSVAKWPPFEGWSWVLIFAYVLLSLVMTAKIVKNNAKIF